MSRPRRATCARCQRPERMVAKVFPDGPLCAACRAEAIRRLGRCARCGSHRLLPGVDAAGKPLCCECAGIDEDYTCRRCGTEWALRHGLCEWCSLGYLLDKLMQGPVDLSPLRERLLSAARPDRVIIWLCRPHARRLLHELSVGSMPLTHQGLDGAANKGAAEHLRSLLSDVGLLPARDENLARFDRWVTDRLPAIVDTSDDLKLLQRFATWRLRPDLVAHSSGEGVGQGQLHHATQVLRVASSLLSWLRARHRSLESCTQADLDVWFATPPSTRLHAVGFLRWAMATQRCPKLALAPRSRRARPALDQDGRLAVLRRLLESLAGRLEHRVAAMLVALLAQPFNKIATLQLTDVVIDGHSTGVRLGQGVTPIPSPFDAMVQELVGSRSHLNTGTNPTSVWLFPGKRAGTHVTPSSLRLGVIAMDVDLLGARIGALRQLVMECPPTVVADMLGYHYETTDRHAVLAGSRWGSYAALRAGDLPTGGRRRRAASLGATR